MRARGGLVLALLASGCVAPPEPAPPAPTVPVPRPSSPPVAAPAPAPADWRDRAFSPGDWSFARAGGASEARYGALRIACEAGQVRLAWARVSAGPLTVRTTYGDTARASSASAEGLSLSLAPRDPLLDQIAFSRGRFMLAAGGQELILPTWAELVRVVEDCR